MLYLFPLFLSSRLPSFPYILSFPSFKFLHFSLHVPPPPSLSILYLPLCPSPSCTFPSVPLLPVPTIPFLYILYLHLVPLHPVPSIPLNSVLPSPSCTSPPPPPISMYLHMLFIPFSVVACISLPLLP